jgi:hypothetical protein
VASCKLDGDRSLYRDVLAASPEGPLRAGTTPPRRQDTAVRTSTAPSTHADGREPFQKIGGGLVTLVAVDGEQPIEHGLERDELAA